MDQIEKKLEKIEKQIANVMNPKLDWNEIPFTFHSGLSTKEPIPGTSHDDEGFKITNKRSKVDKKMEASVPTVELGNKFAALADFDTETPVEKTDSQHHMITQDVTSNSTSEVKKPPPIVIREKKNWPNINESLKNLGIKSVKNFNTRDGIRMILPPLESYNKCTDILDQQKVIYYIQNTRKP
ncbi:hypothetical protein JTB14_000235 [Gonioctena quinquepunctata]|nr:hypothetical protein JTB14_000235 [Gonioctena quinquepunctata]